MLIAEFCRRAELTRDAVRLYVKLGLIRPSTGGAGSNRYQHFHESDVDRVALIKVGQLSPSRKLAPPITRGLRAN